MEWLSLCKCGWEYGLQIGTVYEQYTPPENKHDNGKNTIVNRRYIFKWLVFHCHVSFPGCRHSVMSQHDILDAWRNSEGYLSLHHFYKAWEINPDVLVKGISQWVWGDVQRFPGHDTRNRVNSHQRAVWKQQKKQSFSTYLEPKPPMLTVL